MVELCRFMNWDYWTYSSQPAWFIELVEMIMEIDSIQAKIEANKLKSNG